MRRDPFLILCGAGLFAIFSSTISKSPALPLFATHLGADPAGVGLVSSISAFTGIIASIPAGIMSDRFGRKRMLVVSGMIFATAPFLYLFTGQLWQLGLVRFFHGFATAIFIPVGMAFVSENYESGRGEKIGWFSTSTLLGRFAAPFAGGIIIGLYAAAPGAGFGVVYTVCGVTGLLSLLLILRLPGEKKAVHARADWSRAFAEFGSALSNWPILATSAVEASVLFAYGAFETFLPLHAVVEGHSAFKVGLILSSQVLSIALTKPLMGRFSDRHGRRPQIIAGALAGAVCMAGISYFKGFVPLLLVSISFGLSISIVTSATSAYVADLCRREGVGSAMGILGSVMDIGHTAGPVAAGVIAASYGFGMAFLGASAVLAAVGVMFSLSAGLSGRTTNPAKRLR